MLPESSSRPFLPSGLITQLSPYMTRNPGDVNHKKKNLLKNLLKWIFDFQICLNFSNFFIPSIINVKEFFNKFFNKFFLWIPPQIYIIFKDIETLAQHSSGLEMLVDLVLSGRCHHPPFELADFSAVSLCIQYLSPFPSPGKWHSLNMKMPQFYF